MDHLANMYINLLLLIITFIYYCSSTSYAPPKLESFDGTYAFTVLAEEFNINICTNDAHESYMSINAINSDNLAHADYVFGAFRDLRGAQEVECGVFVLYFEGFQMLPPESNGFEAMKYKFTVDTNSYKHQYSLSRSMGDEVFILEKISMVPLTYCFEPGDYSLVSFPAVYQSIDLIGSGLCEPPGTTCFEIQNAENAQLDPACWAHVHSGNDAFRGGELSSLSIEWGGLLSLETWSDGSATKKGGACPGGAQMVVADPNDPQNTIILTKRCAEGHLGYIFELKTVHLLAPCPIFEKSY